jgi:MFS transporter, FHS family, glucose/mannose:H+ symporter
MANMKIGYIVFAYISLFSLGLIDNTRGPVYPNILEFFQLNNAQGAWIFTLSSLSSFITAFFSKKWLSIFGIINSSKLALLMHTIACLIMGLSSNQDYILFLIAAVIFGVGVGILSLTLNLIISRNSALEHRRRTFAGLHSMYGIASLLAPILVGYLGMLSMHWQTLFLIVSLIPLSCLVVFFLSPNQVRLPDSVSQINLNHKRQFLLAMIFSGYISAEVLLSSRLVIYLTQVKDLSLKVGSEYLSYFFLCLLLGRLTFTFIHIKVDSKKLLIISLLSSIIFSVLGILVSPILLTITGLSMSYFFPCAMDWLSESLHTEVENVLGTIMIYVGGSLVLSHWVFGTLATYIGLSAIVWIIPALLVIVWFLLQFATGFLAKPDEFVRVKT